MATLRKGGKKEDEINKGKLSRRGFRRVIDVIEQNNAISYTHILCPATMLDITPLLYVVKWASHIV
jgi:hypothetical protein